MPDGTFCSPVKMTCFNVGKAFDESSRAAECCSSSGTSCWKIFNDGMILTSGLRIRPLQPTLFMQYSSSRPTYAGLILTYGDMQMKTSQQHVILLW